ncbi:MAG: MBL fold metallo-hydrolase [Tannerella sp.]|jgi:glyoxylase-like metal-dependent hydrolase (beta-lactamase superfamily II)|nr:MBL fold metallo-hydrolase [Tannerella sp.]
MITVKTFEFNPVVVNTYLLYDETKEAVLIDCGCATTPEERMLSEFVRTNDLKVKRLLCTHLHFDHIVGNAFASTTYGLQPEAHRNEIEFIPPVKEQMKLMKLRLPIKEVPVTKFLTGNEQIRFGDSELTTILVPGHSPGSLAYYSRKDGFIVIGDALFRESIGRTDLWGGNYELLVTVIREKILSLPDETIVYSGHGPSTTVYHEKIHNPFF